MKFLQSIFSLFNRSSFSATKLNEKYILEDYAYIKKAFLNASNYLKIQAVEYLSQYNNQQNLDFLIEEFKRIENLKLKSYTYNSILILLGSGKLGIGKSDEILIRNNYHLLQNLGVVKAAESKDRPLTPIKFREKLKDHLEILEDKKRLNEGMSGF